MKIGLSGLSSPNVNLQMSSEQNPSFLLYTGDYSTQLYRDRDYNKPNVTRVLIPAQIVLSFEKLLFGCFGSIIFPLVGCVCTDFFNRWEP